MNKDTPFKRHGKDYECYCQVEMLKDEIGRIGHIKRYLDKEVEHIKKHLDEMEKGYKSLIKYFRELENAEYNRNEEMQKTSGNTPMDFSDLRGTIVDIDEKVKELRSKMKLM